jgi:D-amino-acid oxidase
LTTSGRAAIGFAASAAGAASAASGCATRRRPALIPGRAPVRLAPVNVSWNRIIRTTVGLRPHRDAGFVLKADKLDDRTLIHNYGHGGAGMSLSWGTGSIAADMALQDQSRRAAVVGCGVVGLTTARELQRRGFEVTIYAMAVPPDVTSSMSLAGFTPTSGLIEPDRRTPEWDEQFRRAAEIAYRRLQTLVGRGYGVSWLDQYTPTDEIRPPQTDLDRPRLDTGLGTEPQLLQAGEHPFSTRYAIRRAVLRIEPSIYLDALMRDFVMFGGHIVIRQFDAPHDLMSLHESVIANCSGLGSHDLFADKELVPLKGQLTVLVPQSEVNYRTTGGVKPPPVFGLGIHMMPRADGIVLGGTSQRGVWTMEPDEAERRRIVDDHLELFSRMNGGRP